MFALSFDRLGPLRLRLASFLALAVCLLTDAALASAQEAPSRWAVILVGLPGDTEHEQIFRESSTVWEEWSQASLGIPSERIRVLSAVPATGADASSLAPTRENISKAFEDLAERIGQDDQLWLFVLGHGHFDGEQARLHLPGPDLSARELADLLADVKCREQVVWLTQASSGGWVKPLSSAGRAVITATADETEENETEFPHALAKVMKLPPAELDLDKDQQVSLRELFQRAVAETQARFDANKRLPTEHALLDDNGDGRGTEVDKLSRQAENAEPMPNATVAPAAKAQDGEAAAGMVLYKSPAKDAPQP